jgi:hypothetical protein
VPIQIDAEGIDGKLGIGRIASCGYGLRVW